MKRTCSDCLALSLEHCQLGHKIESSGAWPLIRYHPAEECEKPRSNRALMLAFAWLDAERSIERRASEQADKETGE